eukprot:CAMPEP_0201529684 /NCGR_PEP_ID=MMETSP0161_2-20130828/42519_1 /ASSEMBLY_ACC=CAM_ASM_000251 /TAXON_ID=180227 /ORGANISM="Neoparamoeba aestuarina, Strain SoJaBio B1-5/56/2" /LENGTH=177 /DNA_ID=CAMNT_0047931621 /DNA_START=93 /DNA_END=622 /DNA_ORIENTATION=-
MELFVEDIDNTDSICGSNAEPTDISEWSEVTLNDDMEVIEINWSYMDIDGVIKLEWLPSTIQKLSIVSDLYANGWLIGTLDLTVLPESLNVLHLGGNYLKGTVDLTCLPKAMRFLDISSNELSGTLDLTRLPPTLAVLNLSWNKFEGDTDFSHLPDSLNSLDIRETHLAGILYVDSS